MKHTLEEKALIAYLHEHIEHEQEEVERHLPGTPERDYHEHKRLALAVFGIDIMAFKHRIKRDK